MIGWFIEHEDIWDDHIYKKPQDMYTNGNFEKICIHEFLQLCALNYFPYQQANAKCKFYW